MIKQYASTHISGTITMKGWSICTFINWWPDTFRWYCMVNCRRCRITGTTEGDSAASRGLKTVLWTESVFALVSIISRELMKKSPLIRPSERRSTSSTSLEMVPEKREVEAPSSSFPDPRSSSITISCKVAWARYVTNTSLAVSDCWGLLREVWLACVLGSAASKRDRDEDASRMLDTARIASAVSGSSSWILPHSRAFDETNSQMLSSRTLRRSRNFSSDNWIPIKGTSNHTCRTTISTR